MVKLGDMIQCKYVSASSLVGPMHSGETKI